jgi:RNA polymerase sigma factor (TIGR02999 family)
MHDDLPADVTQLLDQARAGCRSARAEVIQQVYAALRAQAAALLRRERPGATLQPTAVLHEALLKMLRGDVLAKVEDREQLFGVATAFMRYVLVTHARARRAGKRGGGRPPLPLDESLDVAATDAGADADGLLEALEHLAERHPRPAQVVTLRYFGGLTMAEAAERLSVSLTTAEGDLRFARAWLRRALTGEDRP